MDSSKNGQRKRKSPNTNNIFEVNEDDLSAENSESEEPEAKVKKTDHSNVYEKQVSQSPSNLQNEQKIDISEDSFVPKIRNDIEDKFDENIIKEVSILEEGEVSEFDSKLNNNTSQDSYITITFKDREAADIYRKPFLKFLQTFVELQIEDSANTVIKLSRTANVNPTDWVIIDDSLDLTQEVDEELAKELPVTPQSGKKKKKKKKKKDLFVLDTTPGLEDEANQTKYWSRFLINEAEKKDEQAPHKRPIPSTCFNCSQNHNMKDCPMPKNYSVINSNRQKLANKNKACRYHLEGDQKYSHLCPGKISTNLQKALGLHKNQIPKFFYKMREWGYPPGWLEEAKIVKSDLAMFDIHGNHVKNTHARNIKGLDPEKLIDYPGFNIPLEKHIKDESRHHHMPPYSRDYSKEIMIDFYEKQCMEEEDNSETQDMDLSKTNETEIVEIIEITDTELQSKEILTIKESLLNAPSPSLNELEKEKETLLEQLIDTDEVSNSAVLQDDQATSQTEHEEPKQSNEKKTDSNEPVEIDLTKTENEDYLCSTPITKRDTNISVRSVTTSTFGTPILKSSSPYSTLPNPDNFSKDVSPVINFENLPNSTGKYEQMTGVLQKVRTTLKGLNQCKS
ncbi:zinc finger CCHC domain-containing protein 8 homolog [Cylas formicarius]|uniref:zinc finger CCHC domain-containing protein 8 homolog n=1 Tax=Cylas formicarius TaxID=197179 RepID=UPI002958328A|nr:zinc finger CCHC domain-containing protein 8 homolog [Cylas formicarius]